jgi:hypothetical protein
MVLLAHSFLQSSLPLYDSLRINLHPRQACMIVLDDHWNLLTLAWRIQLLHNTVARYANLPAR